MTAKGKYKGESASTAETGNGTTHWDECWRRHHGCAIAKIEREIASPTETLIVEVVKQAWLDMRQRELVAGGVMKIEQARIHATTQWDEFIKECAKIRSATESRGING